MTTHSQPTGTMAQALMALPPSDLKATVEASSNYVYFDLLEYMDDKLIQGELKARAFSSLAWLLDMRCINLARAVFFETYRESLETGTIDAFNEFISTMNEKAGAGKHTEEVGFTDATSFSQLVSMLNMRKFWHDEAQKHATRQYNPKTLTELIIGEKAREVALDGRAKIQLRVNFAAGDDKELASQLYERLLAKSNATLAQQHEMRQKINPAVLRIIDLAANKAQMMYDGECPPFHELPIDVQRMFIEASVTSTERALDDMINVRTVTMDDYAIAFKDQKAYVRGIQLVLAAPKFNRD